MVWIKQQYTNLDVKKMLWKKIKNIVKKGDAILIKASNAMKFDEITKELLK